jgi:hypothetical protein
MDTLAAGRIMRAILRRLSKLQRHTGPVPTDTSGCAAAKRVLRAGYAVFVAAVIVLAALHLTNVVFLHGAYPALDAGIDGSISDWISVVAEFAVAAAAAAHARRAADGRLRLALLAAALAFFAVDDAVSLHERFGHALGRWLGGTGQGDEAYLLVYLPALIFAFVGLLGVARDASGGARSAIASGLALLVAAVVARLVAGVLTAGDVPIAGVVRALGVVAMQGAETGAWVLIAAGLTAVVLTTTSARNGQLERRLRR